MAAESIIERIQGVTFTAGANKPFSVDDPERVYQVEEGHLDVFAVKLTDEGETLGRKLFLTRIPAGSMCFGFQRLANDPGEPTVIAVPSQGAVLVEGVRSGLYSDELFALDATIAVDEWIYRLSEFAVRNRRAAPRDALLLDADPDVPHPAGSTVSTHHSEILWVCADQPMRWLGRDDLTVETDREHLLPLSERIWFELGVDTRISAFHTPTVILTERIQSAVDRFSALILAHTTRIWDDGVEAMEERHRRMHTARHGIRSKMFNDLGGVLGETQEHEIGGALPAGRTPLQGALGIVAESIGASLVVPRNIGEDAADPIKASRILTRASGIRTRRIKLASDWWRRVGPSFVGFAGDLSQPLALLSDGRGAYRAVDPNSGATEAVDARRAAEIVDQGLMLLGPLPDEVEGGLAALRHTLYGQGRELGTIVVMAVLGALVALLTPILTGKLLAEIIPRVDTPMWIACLAALVLAALGTATFDIVRALATLRLEGRIDERFQGAVWSRLLSLPIPFFRRFTAGDLADRANGISQIRQLLTGATAGAVIGGVFSIFSYALLFYYSWTLALYAGGLLLVLAGVTWWFAHAQMRHHRASFMIQGIIDGFVFQMLTGLSKLRMANAETDALMRWAERFARQKRESLAARRWVAGQLAFNSMFTPLASLSIFAVIWFSLITGGRQASFGLADFLSFNAAFGQFAAAMTGLTAAWSTVVSAIPLFERVQPILEAQPETAGGRVDPGDLIGDIEFTNVAFSYLPDGPNAVDGVSFRIRPGEFVAFVGPSGSGKSTIYRLLLGFEQLDSGTILFDGHDISSLDMPAARSYMGVVLQNGRLSAASIYKNISSTSAITMDEAWSVAEAVGLDADIREMPMGMHTVLSEGGGGLSGGQRQRLLLARALAHKPRILLLDEATSALDNHTQAIVQASLKKISVTRVVIAHRLSTIQDADRIFVVEKGRIVESGRYDTLMRQDGVFAALARRQIV